MSWIGDVRSVCVNVFATTAAATRFIGPCLLVPHPTPKEAECDCSQQSDTIETLATHRGDFRHHLRILNASITITTPHNPISNSGDGGCIVNYYTVVVRPVTDPVAVSIDMQCLDGEIVWH